MAESPAPKKKINWTLLVIYGVLISVVASWIPLVLIARSRVVKSPRKKIHLFLDMDQQPKYKTQASASIFADGRAMRPVVEGAVGRDESSLRSDDHYYYGYRRDEALNQIKVELTLQGEDGQKQTMVVPDYYAKLPSKVSVTEAFLHQGRKQYDIYCGACHGHAGYGDGMVKRRVDAIAQSIVVGDSPVSDFGVPANFHADQRLIDMPAGEVFSVISDGSMSQKMKGYKTQIDVEDRWAIVAYLKALQLSQRVSVKQLPQAIQDQVAKAPWNDDYVAPRSAGQIVGKKAVATSKGDSGEANEASADWSVDPALVAKGKMLFQTKLCMTCHQVNPAMPAPAGMAMKAPTFMGDFWGKEREVHNGVGGPIVKVALDKAYFLESIVQPMKKIVKGAVPGMAPMPTTEQERTALMHYVRSLSKSAK